MPVIQEPRMHLKGLVQSMADSCQAYLDNDDCARTNIIAQARTLIGELESPNETVTWLAWAEPTRRAAILTAIHLDIFPLLTNPRTAPEISAFCGASLPLVGRLLRHLAATSVITETGSETYSSTRLSRSLCDPKHRAALIVSAELTGPVLARLPAYLASTQHRDPQGGDPTPFQFALETRLSPWKWASTRPEIAEAFVLHMSGYHDERPSWMDDGFYPVEERLFNGCKNGSDEVVLVDVGGGLGHDLEELRSKCSTMMGGRRLILQDLFEQRLRAAAKLRPWLEAMAYDFFTPQPIKGEHLDTTFWREKRTLHLYDEELYGTDSIAGARAYYLHSVLHDWPDEQCRQILHNLRNAMEPGYSRILINENIVSKVGASWKITSLDWNMMAMAASSERTEAQWRELIGSAGLRVTGVWVKDPACESLIEVDLVEEAKLSAS